jgi:acetyl esterase/lipase
MAKVLRAEPACLRRRNMQTPTLVIHGALDYRVPDAQGLAYYNTLKARGVDARLLWFPDENHWILKPRNSRSGTTSSSTGCAHDRPPARPASHAPADLRPSASRGAAGRRSAAIASRPVARRPPQESPPC